MKNKMLLLWLFILSLNLSCKKPYDPPAVPATTNYLVVEGLINTGSDSTIISLSRTVKLDSNTVAKPELHAMVSVQDANNSSYPLAELGKGRYGGFLNLDQTKKYRLHITTTDGVEYASDNSASINTPDIDSIPYKVTSTGLQFYVNTHNPANNTHYYRWSFEETWLYLSYYQSYFEIVNNTIVLRPQSDNIYTCYKTQASTEILIGSSAKLAQDIIYYQPVNFAPVSSGKIAHGYSFLLKQYGLTQAAYNYWDNLKKNTQNLGSIFDAQPSTLTGNITCITHPGTPVLGFISVSNIKSMRIFVDHNSIALYTPSYIPPPDSSACPILNLAVQPSSDFDLRFNEAFGRGFYTPVGGIGSNGVISYYTYAPNECVDCRLKSPFGTTVKPPFFK